MKIILFICRVILPQTSQTCDCHRSDASTKPWDMNHGAGELLPQRLPCSRVPPDVMVLVGYRWLHISVRWSNARGTSWWNICTSPLEPNPHGQLPAARGKVPPGPPFPREHWLLSPAIGHLTTHFLSGVQSISCYRENILILLHSGLTLCRAVAKFVILPNHALLIYA